MGYFNIFTQKKIHFTLTEDCKQPNGKEHVDVVGILPLASAFLLAQPLSAVKPCTELLRSSALAQNRTDHFLCQLSFGREKQWKYLSTPSQKRGLYLR